MIPDDLTPIDDELLQTLLEEDAALLAGLPRTGEGSDPGLRDCLRLLEGMWPRDRSSRPRPWKVGRFEVRQELGRGGFGIVYRARDTFLGRDVALKVPRPDVLFTPTLRSRFLREARAAGALDHPHIVPVYESGEDGPLCYIASAYCEGPTLSSWLRSRSAPVPARLAARLVESLATAVQHAHDRGVLHRDIKPSNVLLQRLDDDGDDAAPHARLTDFGLARLAEEAHEESRSGVPVGSPSYMAPEQAAGRAREIGSWTDVHALGATLYEVLTGRPPFRGETVNETFRQLREDAPIAPRALRPGLPRELETICLTCLEKSPRQRYATAAELAHDLRRFLDGEPIVARPVSPFGRLARWARRQPLVAILTAVLAATAAGVVALLVLLSLWLGRHNAELRRAVDWAESSERLAKRHWVGSQIRLAQQAWEGGQPALAQDLLASLRPAATEPDLRGFAWFALGGLLQHDVTTLSGHDEWVREVAVAPDGTSFATADAQGELIRWSIEDPHALGRHDHPVALVHSLEFAPDGSTLLVAGEDRQGAGLAQLFPIAGGAAPIRFSSLRKNARAGFLPGTGPPRLFVADGGDAPGLGGLRFWEPFSSRKTAGPAGLSDPRLAVASPDGRRLAVLRGDGALVLVEPDGGRVAWSLPARRAGGALAFSPDGGRLAVHDGVTTTRVHDAATGDVLAESRGDAINPHFLAFGRDGRALVAVDLAGRVALMDPDDGTRKIVRDPDPPDHWAMASLSRDGRSLAVGGRAGHPVTVWRIDPWSEHRVMPGPPIDARVLAFTPDGRELIVGGGDHRVRIWHLDPPPRPSFAGHAPKEVWAVAFSPDGEALFSAGDDFVIRVWDVRTGAARGVLEGHADLITSLAVDPAGRALISGGFDRRVIAWDLDTLRPRLVLDGHEDKVRAVAVSPDGRLIAAGGSDRQVYLWDARDGRRLDVFPAHGDKIRGLAFSPDGATLASAGNDMCVRLWDVHRGGRRRPRRELLALANCAAVAFSPDGRAVAGADEEGNVLLWDPATGTLKGRLRSDGRPLYCLAFSADGQAIAAGGVARVARLWDVVTGQELLALRGHEATIRALAFDPETRWLATGAHDGTLTLWDGRRAADCRPCLSPTSP